MTSEQTTILVTGASGFLGKAVIKASDNKQGINLIATCRNKNKLAYDFNGEIRQGDLRDPKYRAELVKGVDVICHTGTWAAMWGHRQQERDNFYLPTKALIDTAMHAGVKRFLMTSTVVIAEKHKEDSVIDNFSDTRKTGFWPHVDYLVDIENYMQANAQHGMQMITMRLGHFIGAGNKLGLVPVLVPRLKT